MNLIEKQPYCQNSWTFEWIAVPGLQGHYRVLAVTSLGIRWAHLKINHTPYKEMMAWKGSHDRVTWEPLYR